MNENETEIDEFISIVKELEKNKNSHNFLLKMIKTKISANEKTRMMPVLHAVTRCTKCATYNIIVCLSFHKCVNNGKCLLAELVV